MFLLSLENLEKKVEIRKAEVSETATNVDCLKIRSQLDAIYRLINNINRREERLLLNIEKNLQYVENKQNVIIGLLGDSGLDVSELKKQEKIKELEQKINELKGV